MADRGNKRFVFVIGGARSGKSSFAMKLAESSYRNAKRVYIATAKALDSEMAERIDEHKTRRGKGWTTVEEPLQIEKRIRESSGCGVIVIDCLTLWLTNLLCEGGNDREVLKEAERVASACSECGSGVIAVSNEVGLGIVPENPLGRRFRDLAGQTNQFFAEAADEVFLVTAGIPLKIK
jgi:adenosylcobinamide kinase/adenosylcobinamide-phosphate guanylyltransferase